jgi:asparagine synthase (glutamine-hydrolysing)
MCGFIASFFLDSGNPEIEYFENCDLSHRGPDAVKEISGTNFKMRFHRLAIRDLEGGEQPLQDNEVNYLSMINGELYNEDFIRAMIFEKFPGDFLPTGDMQLLGHFLWRFGPQRLSMVDGMFAGLVWIAKSQKVIFFRDKTGEKPLYYKLENSTFILGSEASIAPKRKIDRQSAIQFSADLVRGFPRDGSQFFSTSNSLPNGHWGEFGFSTGISLHSYWQWPERQSKSLKSLESLQNEFQALFYDEVASRMVSDIPLCTLLSGGIDSALVTLAANRVSGRKLTSFTLGFKDSEYDESKLAGEVAKHLNVNHELVFFEMEDLAQFVPSVLSAMDVPIFDTACVSLYALSKEVSKSYKVAITGDGGDELFMGYRLFQHIRHVSSIQKYSKGTYPLLSLLGSITSKLEKNQSRYLSHSTYLRRLRDISRFNSISPQEIALSPLAGSLAFKYIASNINFDSKSSFSTKCDPLTELEKYYREGILPNVFLVKADRMSMAHGLELRAPLLSPRLIDIANSIGLEDLKKLPQKAFMREFAKKELPRQLLKAEKHGFAAPFAEIKKYLDEPDWEVESLGIPNDIASAIWKSKSENDGIASWTLMILNHFIQRPVS